MKSLVTIRKCASYDHDKLDRVVEQLFVDLGGAGKFISRGARILLKPNLLMSAVPDRAVVTHPALIEKISEMIIDLGARPSIGDSPPVGNLNRVLARSGYEPFIKRLGLQVVPFATKKPTTFSDGRVFKKIDLAAEVFDFDAVVNIAKLKTHAQMGLTLAVKNLFGTVIGTDKATWHMRAGKDLDLFATALAQIYEKVGPVISIVDGILGMEGYGPSAGNPRLLGILGASPDAVALDSVLCRLVGFPLSGLRTCAMAEKMGIGVANPENIEQIGDRPDGFPLTDFDKPKSVTMMWNLPVWHPIRRFMENHMVTRPGIDPLSCENCGVCSSHCPPQAIKEVRGVLKIDKKKCISCFCCHELCQNNAVQIIRPFWGKVISRISKKIPI